MTDVPSRVASSRLDSSIFMVVVGLVVGKTVFVALFIIISCFAINEVNCNYTCHAFGA